MTVNANEVIEDDAVEDEDQPQDEQVTSAEQMDRMPDGSLVRYRQQRYYKDGEVWGTEYESGERARATIHSGTFSTAIARGDVFVVTLDPEEQVRILREHQQTIEQARDEAIAERDAARADVEQKDQRFDNLIEALHEKAVEKDYCSDFDEVMDELGLPARPREYDVIWNVTYRVTTTVRSTDEDEAHNQVDREAIIEAVRGDVSYPDTVEHHYTELS